jgi:hypothetical protein
MWIVSFLVMLKICYNYIINYTIEMVLVFVGNYIVRTIIRSPLQQKVSLYIKWFFFLGEILQQKKGLAPRTEAKK